MKNLIEKILDSDLMEKVMLVMAHIGVIACVVCLIITLANK